MNARKTQSSGVLSDHKRVGKKFIPSLLSEKVEQINFARTLLPQILWIGLILDEFGTKRAITLSASLVDAVNATYKDKDRRNFALAESYSALTKEQTEQVIETLSKSGHLESLRHCLSPLAKLYSEFPMRFLGNFALAAPTTELLDRVKKATTKYFDKHDQSTSVLQAIAVYIHSVHNKIHFAQHLRIPNLELVITDPDSEDGKYAASFARTTLMQAVMVETQFYSRSFVWPTVFWNTNLSLYPCETHIRENE